MSDQITPVSADDAGRILLVDDEATNLDVLRKTLTGQNYHLFVARSGEDAMKIARRARPLLILLDVVMPGIDGYETCRRLKDDPETRDAAVIFLSALTDPKDKVRGFEAGAVDFITKPFVGGEVIARVNAHLEIQRLLRRQAEARPPDAPHDANEAATLGPLAGEEGRSAESVFRTGDVVAFRFRIVRYLARGGMGELYEAEDLELRERVALKTILPSITENERSIVLVQARSAAGPAGDASQCLSNLRRVPSPPARRSRFDPGGRVSRDGVAPRRDARRQACTRGSLDDDRHSAHRAADGSRPGGGAPCGCRPSRLQEPERDARRACRSGRGGAGGRHGLRPGAAERSRRGHSLLAVPHRLRE